MVTPAGNLTSRVREHLSRRFAELHATRLGTEQVLVQSTQWKGFDCAVESWHTALWAWVDSETPVDVVARVKALQVDWAALPPATESQKEWDAEVFRQQYLQRHAHFLLGMRGPEAEDPETYMLFPDDLKIAERIGDKTYFEELAKQKQRKPTKDRADRRLKHHLLLDWIPACIWAFTREGIRRFLQDRYGVRTYHLRTIRRAYTELRLFHAPRPLWKGIKGTQVQLIPSR